MNDKVNAIMQIAVTIIVLIVGVAMLSAPNAIFPAAFSESTQKIAAGWVGLIIGYWLS